VESWPGFCGSLFLTLLPGSRKTGVQNSLDQDTLTQLHEAEAHCKQYENILAFAGALDMILFCAEAECVEGPLREVSRMTK
jgi:hypothetical protein